MIEWLTSTTNVIVFVLYFVAFSALVYGFTLLAERLWQNTVRWRGFWIAAVGLCLMPFVSWLMPAPSLVAPLIELPELVPTGHHAAAFVAAQSQSASQPGLWHWLSGIAVLTLLGVALARIFIAALRNWQLRRWVMAAPRVHGAQQVASKALQTSGYAASSGARNLCLLRRLARVSGLDIRTTGRRCSPFVVGWLVPRLVVSQVAIERLTPAQFALMIRHELTHVARADLLLAGIAQWLRSLCWFNPFIQRLLDQMHWAAEASCDSTVLTRKPQASQHYARAMVNLLRETCVHTQAPNGAVAFIHHTRRSTTMRMQWILNATHNLTAGWVQRLVAMAGAAVLTAGAFLLQPGFAMADSKENCSYTNPVAQARVTSRFGQQKDRFHNGVDLAIAKGTPVVAAGDGKVIVSTDVLGKKVNYGKIIVIAHADGLKSLYSHLDSRAVEKGDWVSAGQKIGEVGETGKVTGPHLHFEILKGKERVDPADYVDLPLERKQASLRLPPVM